MALPTHTPAPGAALPCLGPSKACAAGPTPQPAARLPAWTVWMCGPAGHPGYSCTDTGSWAGKKAAANPLRKDANAESMKLQISVLPHAAVSILPCRKNLDLQGCLQPVSLCLLEVSFLCQAVGIADMFEGEHREVSVGNYLCLQFGYLCILGVAADSCLCFQSFLKNAVQGVGYARGFRDFLQVPGKCTSILK